MRNQTLSAFNSGCEIQKWGFLRVDRESHEYASTEGVRACMAIIEDFELEANR